jgi:hypothetical protein
MTNGMTIVKGAVETINADGSYKAPEAILSIRKILLAVFSLLFKVNIVFSQGKCKKGLYPLPAPWLLSKCVYWFEYLRACFDRLFIPLLNPGIISNHTVTVTANSAAHCEQPIRSS